jgi:hypothetical protein
MDLEYALSKGPASAASKAQLSFLNSSHRACEPVKSTCIHSTTVTSNGSLRPPKRTGARVSRQGANSHIKLSPRMHAPNARVNHATLVTPTISMPAPNLSHEQTNRSFDAIVAQQHFFPGEKI